MGESQEASATSATLWVLCRLFMKIIIVAGNVIICKYPVFFYIIVEVLSLWLLLFKRKCVLRWFPAMALLVVCLAKKENGVDFRMAANRWRRLWPGFVASFDRFRFPISMELRWRFFDGFSGMVDQGKDVERFFEILEVSLRFFKILEDALKF